MIQDVAVILLAGGSGQRFGSSVPKQFLPLQDKPIALHSLHTFLQLKELTEIIIVCPPTYRHLFPKHPKISFAPPGERRQDSVYHGLQALHFEPKFVLVHDAARPFITEAIIKSTIEAARAHGAAAVAVPVKCTIKESCPTHFVKHTPDRSHLFEMQTPQVIKLDWLYKGFEVASDLNITVTDDVSLVELLGKPVKLVEGSYSNIKITTPEDLILAKHILEIK